MEMLRGRTRTLEINSLMTRSTEAFADTKNITENPSIRNDVTFERNTKIRGISRNTQTRFIQKLTSKTNICGNLPRN